jgi:hypothetical protein
MNKQLRCIRATGLLTTIVAALVIAVSVSPTLAPAAPQKGVHDDFASSSSVSIRHRDVVELSQRLRRVIRAVERAQLSCDLKNTLVRRLRRVDDALLTGRHSAASALLQAWMYRIEAVAATGALESVEISDHDNIVQALLSIHEEIGTGWPEHPKRGGHARHWPPLQHCGSPPGRTSVGETSEEFDLADVEALVQGLLSLVPKVGDLLSGLVGVLWPDSGPDIYDYIQQAVDTAIQEEAIGDMLVLQNRLDAFNLLEREWHDACVVDLTDDCAYRKQDLQDMYPGWVDDFRNEGVLFQLHSPDDYRLNLLPLYAQYETMYLGLLREGLLYGDQWGLTPTKLGDYRKYMDEELYGTDETRGIAYVTAVYEMNKPTDPADPFAYTYWRTQNAYTRDLQISVLDFRTLWPYMDPDEYPDGYPVKLTRMIYSDSLGCWTTRPELPANDVTEMPDYLTVWQDKQEWFFGNEVIDALQIGFGSYQSINNYLSPIMGDTTPDGSALTWTSLVSPPTTFIDRVHSGEGWAGDDDHRLLQGLTFYFSDGTTLTRGSFNNIAARTDIKKHDFSYTDHVLANAKIATYQTWNWGDSTADCLVIGFRYIDSY